MKNVKKGTIIRTIIAFVALINSILVMFGKNPLPFAEKDMYEVLSGFFLVASMLANWWYNNSFTKEAIEADEYLDEQRNKPEQLGGSGMKFSAWVKKYIGKKTDWDGMYGVQCVDLIDCYISECLGLKKGFGGNAKEWWQNRNKSQWLKNNFYFITPTYTDGELKQGDIGIRTSGTYGHIFVIAGKNANGDIKYYDQNYQGSGAGMTLRVKPYTSDYINGILRPKNQTNIKEETTVAKYGNAQMKSVQTTYANSDLTDKVGSVSKGERVLYLGTGEGRPIIAYKVTGGYKVGFVAKDSVVRD